MTQWFSKLFGRGSAEVSSEIGRDRDGAHAARSEKLPGTDQPAVTSRGPGRNEADLTQRIDRARTTERLAWPARDAGGSEPNGERAPPARQSASRVDPHEAPTRLVGSAGARSRRDEPDSSPRSPARERQPAGRRAPEPAATDDTTRLVAPAETERNDPVVGWLVILEGPGRGRSLEIGAGANPIGRAQHQKIRLDFGDTRISRERHAVLVYDPRSRRFFLQNGEVRNLTYVGDDVVLAAVELGGGETITIGETQLQFVAFCGPQFGWS